MESTRQTLQGAHRGDLGVSQPQAEMEQSWERLMAGQTAVEVPEGWDQDQVLQGSEGRVRRGFVEREGLPRWALLKGSHSCRQRWKGSQEGELGKSGVTYVTSE